MNYLIGKINYISSNYVIIENNFIGYKVIVPNTEGFELDKYKKLFIYKRIQIVNNSLTEELYGFTSFKDKIFFEKLLTVSGIGPKTAASILKNNINEIKLLIKDSNIEGLCELNGINKKIAYALVSEITIDEKDIDADYVPTMEKVRTNHDYKYEVISALQTLGYKKDLINKTINSSLTEEDFDLHSEEELTDLISRIIKEMSQNIELENK